MLALALGSVQEDCYSSHTATQSYLLMNETCLPCKIAPKYLHELQIELLIELQIEVQITTAAANHLGR